jgi:hypothetical protein
MTKILDRLPIHDRPADEPFGDRYVRVKRDQILVWVSIYLTGVLQPEANIPKIPALLDTGNNFDFSIQHRQLREWAGLDPQILPLLGSLEINDQVVEPREATVWLYPNIPGTRKPATDRAPLLLEMGEGIAVYPSDAIPPGPRLPLLGLPAVLNNELDFWIDPEMRQVSVQTRTWRRRIMRLLRKL